MKFLLLFIASILAVVSASAQVYLNINVDTTDPDIHRALQFHRAYLQSFKRDTLPDFTKYWSAADCGAFKCPDPAVYGISGDYPTYSMAGRKPSILYFKPKKDYIHAKTFIGTTMDSGEVFTLAIMNHYIKTDPVGKMYYITPLQAFGKDWQQTTVRNMTWHYPASHQFNRQSADSMLKSIDALEKTWGIKPIDIRYYFADTEDELLAIRGFDYTMVMGNPEKPSGISNDKDNTVYCNGLGENYFHEVVHIYLNRRFPNSPLREGLAVFYGGSMGHDLDWHLKRMKKFLKDNPDTDMSDIRNMPYMDNNTNPSSCIMGLLCRLAYKKDGFNGLMRIMNHTNMDDVYAKEFNVTGKGKNRFLREKIGKM